jgi:hypothetical protein
LAHHGVEVGESADECGELGEALLEGVAEVVGGVGGDDEHRLANGGEEDGEDRAARGLPDAALAADEDPLEGVLLEEVPHRGLWHVASVHRRRGRHAPIPVGDRRARGEMRSGDGRRWRVVGRASGAEVETEEELSGLGCWPLLPLWPTRYYFLDSKYCLNSLFPSVPDLKNGWSFFR